MKTIFVSSTFKDMHYERDAIELIVAPKLNDAAIEYGDTIDFCDLRWGINTGDLDTDEGSKKVLDVCLDEIDHSAPPMVVLLGYRYGWIPDAGLIKTAAERKDFEIRDLEKSVTALEVEYGALCDENKLQNTLFYFREIEGYRPPDYLEEDEVHKEKISALKNEIKARTGGRVKTYTLKWNEGSESFDGIEDFAGMLFADIRDKLMSGWEETKNLTPFQRERMTHDTFIREKNEIFRARWAEAEKFMNYAVSYPVTVIRGEAGSGKSTLFCHMVTELRKTDWTVIPFISGLTKESDSAADIIRNTVCFIEEELNIHGRCIDEKDSKTGERQGRTLDEWREKLAEICSAYAKTGKKVLIMLDAADQLTPGEERDKLHFIPKSVSENIHFVMTCTKNFPTPGQKGHTLERLGDEDKRDVINGILSRSRKELSASVLNAMLESENSDNPLYLSLLVQRLLMMNSDDYAKIRSRGDGMTAIEQYQRELIMKCPKDLGRMSAALLIEAGKRINEKLVLKASEYLAVSRFGLRSTDLAELLGKEWRRIDFSHFVKYMGACFLERNDGRLDFTHKSIREGFLRQCRDLDEVNRNLFEHFKSLKADDPVRKSEIIYHAVRADDKFFFVDYVMKYKFHHDTSYIDLALKDIYSQCIEDRGAWMMEVLSVMSNCEAYDELSFLIDFSNFDLNYAFSGSQKELEIRLAILSLSNYHSRLLYNKLGTNRYKRQLSVSCEKLAGIYEKLDGRKNFGRALKLYQESLKIREQLAGESDTADNRTELSIGYERLAGIWGRLDGRDNLKKALNLYRKELKINKQLTEELDSTNAKRNLAISYSNIAGIHERLGSSKDLRHAWRLRKNELAIMRQLDGESHTTGSRRDLSISCRHMAGVYVRLDGIKNLKRALKLCEEALELSRQVAAELGSAGSRSELSGSYAGLAGIYERLGSRDDLEQALKLYQESLKIDELLAEELGTEGSKRALCISCNNVAGIYEQFRSRKDLREALKLYKKSLKTSKLVAKELATASGREELSDAHVRAASIYERLGGRSNLKRALKLYQGSLKIDRQLAKELDTDDSKRALSFSYNNVAAIYERFAGREDLRQALALYLESLSISRQMAEKLGTSGSKRSLSAGYGCVAGIYEQLGGRQNLGYALKLYLEALEISKPVAEELGSAGSRRELSECYANVVRIYVQLGSREDLNHALDLYRESIKADKQLADELCMPSSIRSLSFGYNLLAGIHERFGGREDLEQALELYRQGFEISERMEKELGTSGSKRSLSASCRYAAGIHKQLGGRQNLEHALELYQKSIEISEKVAKKLKSVGCRKELSDAYAGAAQTHEKLGGGENLMQALELYQKSFDIREQLDKELDTEASKRDLAAGYDGMAGVYKALGGSENLEQALKLYQEGLKMRERLAELLETVDACYELAVSLYHVADHPSTAKVDREDLLSRGLDLAGMLYNQTSLDKYKKLADDFSGLLEM